ncbi:MAG: hypothetical protein OXG04_12555 [Acidobacteria bacterium]|nr:hypothetical protein [Acidobacteriota bacterium]
MAEFNIRSDAVDVEQLMEQIRARLREKRGVDYTEDQIRELASVKLDRFLDPRNVRSDLLEHYRKQRGASPDSDSLSAAEPFEPVAVPPFEPDDVYRSSRGGIGGILRGIRRLLRPVLKLFINPGPMLEAVRALSVHADSTGRTLSRALAVNQERNRARAELDVLTYEVLNNLVVEMTRLAIDLKNHKMRVESVAARLDFDERRSRALEEIVQFRTSGASGEASRTADAAEAPGSGSGSGSDSGSGGEPGPEKKRRRRRRGRRRSGNGAAASNETADGTPGDGEPRDGETADGGQPASAASSGGAPAAADVEPESGTTREPGVEPAGDDTSES